MNRYIFYCVHYTSIASNDKLISSSQNIIIFMLGRFPVKSGGFHMIPSKT